MPDNNDERRVPTVSRVAADTLIELVYDPDKRTTGLVVSRFGGFWNIEQEVRINTGEVLVPYSPRNNLIANLCVQLPSKPTEYGLKHELLKEIEAFLHRYVDLSPLFERIAAHYVLLTWVYDAFNDVPYLRFRGDYGTGKTRALTAIGSLCYKGFFASGASTTSPIFHTLDAFGGTLLLDEADFRFSNATADLVKILNNGTMSGLPVLRTVVNRHKEFNPRAFKVFGPKIIAMRGSFDDKALESRFLTEETGTRPLRSDIPIHQPPALKAEALELRNRLLHFRLCNFFTIKTDPSVVSREIEPRLNQMALSLSSLVDDPMLRADIAAELARHNRATLAERSQSVEAGVASAALEAMTAANGGFISLREVAERFNIRHGQGSGRPPSHKWIGAILRNKLRIRTQKSHGIYGVSLSEKPKIAVLAARLGVVEAAMPTDVNA